MAPPTDKTKWNASDQKNIWEFGGERERKESEKEKNGPKERNREEESDTEK